MPLSLNYLVLWITYHVSHRSKERQVPPVLPSLCPSLQNTFRFLFDSANFIKKATRYAGRATSTCITIAFKDIYFIQDHFAVAAMWKQSQLASPIYIYAYALQNVFGMPSTCLQAYRSDSSGPYKKPFPGTNVEPQNRVDFLTHESLVRAFSGPGLKPSFDRFQRSVERRLDGLCPRTAATEWIQHYDMLSWFRNIIGEALLETLFGKRLLELNPNFVEDLWHFDHSVPWLAKQIPRFLMPKAYKTRLRLLEGIKRWHSVARREFDDGMIFPDGDGDPVWGSYLMRERQSILASVEGQDEEGVAAADLGLIWASITNVVPAAMMSVLHIWNDKDLLARVQYELARKMPSSDVAAVSIPGIDMSSLDKLPILNSVYAETLRCYVQAFITRGSAESDIPIGAWWLPKSGIAMVSSHIRHTDETFWNTMDGKRPVNQFWADRFLVFKHNMSSGPIQQPVRHRMGLDNKRRRGTVKSLKKSEKHGDDMHCDMRGLEGSWIPYGGGFGACPGRILTKKIMIWFTAHMITHYEVEILTKSWEMDNSRYGFGMQKPKQRVAFRMRKL
ncbi:cytochrome P450 [Lentithecium fluviatile CBS 122367]|uniref:Cytochrome P450 n=1 Tax=Lentithecium fluviatile CBS 122367 TaxID=1168545 RepID=A0A6G1IBT9_9PLEO|nr:cytochrome P450 [Lentithecium fluviatile CBS 122367]